MSLKVETLKTCSDGANPYVFGMLSSPVPGHLLPMSSIARALQKNGMRVIYFTLADAAPFLQEMQIETECFGESVFPKGSMREKWDGISRATGALAALKTLLIHRKLAQVSCADLPQKFNERGVTHLILDQNQFQARTIAEYCNLPFVQVTCAVPMNRDGLGDIPPTSEMWSKPKGFFCWIFRLRNKIAFKIIDLSMLLVTLTTKELVKKANLKKRYFLQQTFSDDLTISGLTPSLNWPGTQMPLNYVGCLVGERASNRSAFPWHLLDLNKPLVYVSLGTIHNNIDYVYAQIIQALREMDVQFIVARGKWQKPEQEVEVLSNGIVVSYAPQLEILKRCRVFINHAGINSVMESLSYAVPLVLLPVSNDQPGMAARAVAAGVAVALRKQQWRKKDIKKAVEQVMSSPSYYQKAKLIATEITALGGEACAADLIINWVRK